MGQRLELYYRCKYEIGHLVACGSGIVTDALRLAGRGVNRYCTFEPFSVKQTKINHLCWVYPENMEKKQIVLALPSKMILDGGESKSYHILTHR